MKKGILKFKKMEIEDEEAEEIISEGLILAQKIIRHEDKPSAESCTRLWMLRGKMGDMDKDKTRTEKDIKNIFDQAINICKDSLYKAEKSPQKKFRFKQWKTTI